MPRPHKLTADRMREMRERFRFDKERLDDLAAAFDYGHRASVRNAVLHYERSNGIAPDQREGALIEGPTKAHTTNANP